MPFACYRFESMLYAFDRQTVFDIGLSNIYIAESLFRCVKTGNRRMAVKYYV
jgi:hypothetical protein